MGGGGGVGVGRRADWHSYPALSQGWAQGNKVEQLIRAKYNPILFKEWEPWHVKV